MLAIITITVCAYFFLYSSVIKSIEHMCMLMHQLKTFGKPIESVCASYTCSCYHSTMNQMSPSSPPSSSSSLSLLLLVCQRFMSKNYFNFQNWNRNAAKEKKTITWKQEKNFIFLYLSVISHSLCVPQSLSLSLSSDGIDIAAAVNGAPCTIDTATTNEKEKERVLCVLENWSSCHRKYIYA